MTPAYFALILRGYGRTADERRALLDGTGVDEDALARRGFEITLGQQLRQIRNASRLLDDGWALALGARCHAATHGPIGFAAASAPTLRDGIAVMTRFSTVRAPHFELRAELERDEVRLVPVDRVALHDDEHAALLDVVLLSTQAMVESALGRPVHEARFELAYPEPADTRLHAACFHGAVRFGCRETAVVLPAAWLDLACPLADAATYDAALRTLELGARRLAGDRFLAARVEQVLAVPGTRRDVAAVARTLRVSRRTLARRLRAAGVTYRAVRDAERRSRAEALLRDGRLTIAEVAYALGYEDPANFGRACRRWFGMAPGAQRRRLRDG
jgi:AraC-like DNA-binding protein